VQIHRVDEAGAFVYLAMGYVDGGTLAERLRARGGTLPAAEVVRILREVGWALAYAHARGVVHRDVKPDNILLDRESGRALVTDFGIAHVSDVAPADRLTGEGLVMGTALYMSPEQAAGEPIDGRSDLYSLGVVAYQALAGRPPFEADSAHALLARHLTQEPPALPATVPARLARVVRQCLAKRPDDRPATGEVLAELLDSALPAERTLPAPLRLWVERRDPFLGFYGLWSGAVSIVVLLNVARALLGDEGGRVPLLVPFLLMLAPAVPVGIRTLTRALAVVRDGFGIADLRAAARHQLERSRADRAHERSPVPTWAARLLRLLAYGSAAALVAALFFFVTLVLPDGPGPIPRARRQELEQAVAWMQRLLLLTAGINVLGNALGVTWPTHSGHGTLDALRCRFWESRLGAWLVRLLARGRPSGGGAFIDRPTEHAIGLAADELYAALPAPTRRELVDLPGILRGLQGEAEAMRARADLLERRLSELDGPAAAAAGRRTAVREALRPARDQALDRRESAVTALEALRLDLLRLHADVAPSALTDIVERARRLGGAVDAQVAARDRAGPTLRPAVDTPPG
jgi:serine/threonine-protein kinase